MYNDILKLVAKDEVELAKKIKSNVFKDFNAPEKYLNDNIETANESIAQIISENIK